jgi:hypothetical protein
MMILFTALIFSLFGFTVATLLIGGHREEPDVETPEQSACEHYYTEDDGA